MIDKNFKYNLPQDDLYCQYCGKKCKNLNSLKQHEIRCKKNENRISCKGNGGTTAGYTAWNKGLTKNTDERVNKNSVSVKNFYNSNEGEKTKQTISQKYKENNIFKEYGRIGGIKSAQVQQRRSKNEKYFCELCEKYFKKVLHNESIFNGWDADIIIEDYKIAVLWNGIWHYKQINKKQSLKQIQSRDKIKINEIKKAGYIPYIIKDMGKYNPEFVEQQFNIFIKMLNAPVV